MTKKEELNSIQDLLSQLGKEPQSGAVEIRKAKLDFQFGKIKAKRDAEVFARAEILFEAFLKFGTMRAMHANGTQEEYTGVKGVEGIQRIWNAKYAAHSLADRTTP